MAFVALQGLRATAGKRSKEDGSVLEGEISVLQDPKYRELLRALFYKKGVIGTAFDSRSKAAQIETLKSVGTDANRVVTIMKILDLAREQHRREEAIYLGPSLERAAPIAGRFMKLTGRSMHKSWAKLQRSSTLLYAASQISRTECSKSLLSEILASQAYLRNYKSEVPRWLGYARDINENVLDKVNMSFDAKYEIPKLEHIERIDRPPPVFSEEERKQIADGFRRKRPLKA